MVLGNHLTYKFTSRRGGVQESRAMQNYCALKPSEQSVVLGFLSQDCRVKGMVLPIVSCPLSHRPPTTMDFPSGEQNRQLPNYF